MSEPFRSSGDALNRYRSEVERWNRQINLVSRRGGRDGLRNLIAQTTAACRAALDALAEADPQPGSLAYIDLGSGAGLPAYPWHLAMTQRFAEMATLLVEPREKRAWFLHRLPAVTGAAPWTVACGRWGEIVVDLPVARPAAVVISLKALHLTDAEVLAGLAGVRFAGAGPASGCRISILRFVPADADVCELSGKVEAADPGSDLQVDGGRFRSRGLGLVATPALRAHRASLSLSAYDMDV